MLIFKLAIKNLLGKGIRTWLNVIVLAMAFVIILMYNGMIDGWNAQAKRDTIQWEYANGQLWHNKYDPFDPFAISESHGKLPEGTNTKGLTPILISQATIYPDGRLVPIILKGIPHNQTTLKLPTGALKPTDGAIPVIIGEGMATTSKLKVGDEVTLRWRDANGAFDATEVLVAEIFDTDVPTVDGGMLWIDYALFSSMMGAENEATLFVANESFNSDETVQGWDFKDQSFLLYDLEQVIASERVSGSVMYILLLTIALIAIFDTQVLSVFRRQREIGTYIALGMTRKQVMALFTIEGGANSLLAIIVGGIVGIPFLWWLSIEGIPIPTTSADYGISISDKIYPIYGLGLVLGTTLIMVIAATIVSYFPARKISHMDPTHALKGRIQ